MSLASRFNMDRPAGGAAEEGRQLMSPEQDWADYLGHPPIGFNVEDYCKRNPELCDVLRRRVRADQNEPDYAQVMELCHRFPKVVDALARNAPKGKPGR